MNIFSSVHHLTFNIVTHSNIYFEQFAVDQNVVDKGLKKWIYTTLCLHFIFEINDII